MAVRLAVFRSLDTIRPTRLSVFSDHIEVTRRYSAADVTSESGCCAVGLSDGDLARADGLFVSAFIRATKPSEGR